MKSFFEEYSKFIGLILLVFVIIILFSSPSLLLAKTFTMIDTELSHASGDAMSVRTRIDFGNAEHMDAFPRTIGDWSSSESAASERLKQSLGADMLFMRAYWRPGIPHHVFFTLVQGSNRSSFHPPIVCYPALGYTIKEEGKESIFVQNVSWAEELAIPETKFGEHIKEKYLNESFNGTISVKKLVVAKEKENGMETERRVVLYFYVKNNPLTSDDFTMVEVSSIIPTGTNGSEDGMLGISKEFMGDTIPYMFELRPEGDIIIISLVKLGIVGWFLIVVLLGLPLLVILYPKLKKL